MNILHRAPITRATNIRYKFVELSIVTDDTIQKAVNEWVAKGWILDGIRFVVSDASRRPVMAFISFVQAQDDLTADMDSDEPAISHDGGESGPH